MQQGSFPLRRRSSCMLACVRKLRVARSAQALALMNRAQAGIVLEPHRLVQLQQHDLSGRCASVHWFCVGYKREPAGTSLFHFIFMDVAELSRVPTSFHDKRLLIAHLESLRTVNVSLAFSAMDTPLVSFWYPNPAAQASLATSRRLYLCVIPLLDNLSFRFPSLSEVRFEISLHILVHLLERLETRPYCSSSGTSRDHACFA